MHFRIGVVALHEFASLCVLDHPFSRPALLYCLIVDDFELAAGVSTALRQKLDSPLHGPLRRIRMPLLGRIRPPARSLYSAQASSSIAATARTPSGSKSSQLPAL